MIYFCCDKFRRNEVRGRADINGIDFLEVIDNDAPSDDLRQRRLRLHLLNPHLGAPFSSDNLRIQGGERITDIDIINVTQGVGDEANLVTVEVDVPGDFSRYRLCLIRSDINSDLLPPIDFDPMLVAIDFFFKVECPTDFDCLPARVCPPEESQHPRIDYLAKDYQSFRSLMLDRMSALVPDWQERHAADQGVAVLETLAYTADHLSYEQDALNSEAYLGTARKRVSVRRLARLVDYQINDGSNARCWLQVQVSTDVPVVLPNTSSIPLGTQFFSRIPGQQPRLPNDPNVLTRASVVFESMRDVGPLFEAHNELIFHTWSDARCCLPSGATSATLRGHFPDLQARDAANDVAGEVLVLEEKRGAKTGSESDANPAQRQAVLLTTVRAFDEFDEPLTDPVTNQLITEIEWSAADALRRPFCISVNIGEGEGAQLFDDVSVMRGNIVLVDHGRSVVEEQWSEVPEPRLVIPPVDNIDRCDPPTPVLIPIRYKPSLLFSPVTHAAPLADLPPSASAQMRWDHNDLRPQLRLESNQAGEGDWRARPDLINSASNDEHFVLEIESDGLACLRFGNDQEGKRPNAGTVFQAHYRVGNGKSGNVGVDSLVHVISDISEITEVRNLTPAVGGAEPESIEDVKQSAPFAFRTQQRAVTAADYEEKTALHPEVMQAAATPRWTGSWYTWFLTADRVGGAELEGDFEASVREHVEPFRLAGYDLEVDEPEFVPLEIEMDVCVSPEYFRSDVKQSLLEIFSSYRTADNRVGIFHPDNFSFGEPVYLSPLYAAAHAVEGVVSVEFRSFKRMRSKDNAALDTGVLEMNRLEIAQLSNDRNFPERGSLKLEMRGGK